MSKRYFKYDDLGNIVQMFESSMQSPQGEGWEDVTHMQGLEAVLRRTNLYRKADDGGFALKPTAFVKVSKPELVGDGEDSLEVWVECPEYPEEFLQLHIGDRLIDVKPGERIEISAVDPHPLVFEIKSRIVQSVPTIVRVRKA